MTDKQSVSPPIQHVLAFMEAHFDEPLSLAQLAGMCNRSLYRFATVSPRSKRLFPQLLFSYKLNPQTVFFASYSGTRLGGVVEV